ncbi:hypothetical protein ACQUQP_16465 [Marinobacterium sp. YM272]|uniref:hypothetical protein n=1 Tax=Marinobacterium sp. YM272 TaxID=3421654 RepID=UPI003D7F3B8A
MRHLHRRLSQASVGVIFPNIAHALQDGKIFDSLAEMTLRIERSSLPEGDRHKITSDAARFRRLRGYENHLADTSTDPGVLRDQILTLFNDWRGRIGPDIKLRISDIKYLGCWTPFYTVAKSHLARESDSDRAFGSYVSELCEIDKDFIRNRRVNKKVVIDDVCEVWRDVLMVPDDVLNKAIPYLKSDEPVSLKDSKELMDLSVSILVRQYLHVAVLLEQNLKLVYKGDVENNEFISQFLPSLDEKGRYLSAVQSMFIGIKKNANTSSWNKLYELLAEKNKVDVTTIRQRIRRWRSPNSNLDAERLDTLLTKAGFLMPTELIYTAKIADVIATECFKYNFTESWLIEQCSEIKKFRERLDLRLGGF